MSPVLTAFPPASPRAWQVLRIYLWVVMSLLLVQGSGSLVLRLSPGLAAATPEPLATLFNGNLPHAVVHIAWGLAGLGVLLAHPTGRAILRLAVVFGLFYTLLGLLGLVLTNPFGLRLGWQENLFHLVVGPVMLLLAGQTQRAAGWRGKPGL